MKATSLEAYLIPGTKYKREVAAVAKKDNQESLFMIIFNVDKSDVLAWANELGIPPDQVTDDVIEMLKKKIRQSAGSWQALFKGMIKEAMRCPLDMTCSPSCPWREIGECILPTAQT